MASYTKLKTGAWGIRCNAGAQVGATVDVTTKAGAVKREVIAAVLWRDAAKDLSICAIGGKEKSGYGGSGYRRASGDGECNECGEWIKSANQRCWETGGTCYA